MELLNKEQPLDAPDYGDAQDTFENDICAVESYIRNKKTISFFINEFSTIEAGLILDVIHQIMQKRDDETLAEISDLLYTTRRGIAKIIALKAESGNRFCKEILREATE